MRIYRDNLDECPECGEIGRCELDQEDYDNGKYSVRWRCLKCGYTCTDIYQYLISNE